MIEWPQATQPSTGTRHKVARSAALWLVMDIDGMAIIGTYKRSTGSGRSLRTFMQNNQTRNSILRAGSTCYLWGVTIALFEWAKEVNLN